MRTPTERYEDAVRDWPGAGRHVLAHADADAIVVYQAYHPQIAAAAVAEQRFGGGGFSLARMSWIKTNFLWMMHRCGWASKPNQERVLAVRLPRAAFDGVCAAAVPSAFVPGVHPDREAWQAAVAGSDVRLQWDPDHDPAGRPQVRRAVQLGLRGESLRRFAHEWPLAIEDVTPFVVEQRGNIGGPDLRVPVERVVQLSAPAAERLGVDAVSPRLFTVADVFLLTGRGVVAVSDGPPDSRVRVGDALVLVCPDGSRRGAVVRGIELPRSARGAVAFLLGPAQLTQEEVPAGTVVERGGAVWGA
jgi:hypothetical protein